MKFVNLALVVAIILCGFGCGANSASKNDNGDESSTETGVKIKTNLFDLPDNKQEELKKELKTDDLKILNKEGLGVLEKYIARTVFGNVNPNSDNLQGNYFWCVYNALPDFVDAKERHKGYYAGENKQSVADKLLAYCFYRLDRSPENITTGFNYLKPNLLKIVSKQHYRAINADGFVNEAIASYEQIVLIANYEKLLAEAYTQVDTTTGRLEENENGERITFRNYKNSAYGFSGSEVADIVSKHLNTGRHGLLYGSPFLSFWMRRQHEGNMKVVYGILKEIKQIYQ